jgi:hypothetical protein
MAPMKRDNLQVRRTLLKGALGAPAVFTLPTGAAMAAASLTCIEKAQEQAQASGIQGLTTTPDQWVRAKLVVYEAIPDKPGAVSSSTSGGIGATSPGADANKIKVVTVDQMTTWYDLNGNKVAVKNPKQTGESVYALVDYSSPSNPQLFPAQNPVTSPASTSCAASLALPIIGNLI